MVEIDLRSALEYDAEKGYAIFMRDYENLSYADYDSSDENPRTPEITSIEQYQKTLELSNIFFIISSEEGEVGYIILDVYNSGTAQIKEIAVSKEHRRKRYGRRAIKKLIEGLSEDEEISEVVVISATIATDNFYSSCNFRYTSGDMYVYKLRK